MNKREFNKLADETVIDESLIPKQTPYCYSIDKSRIKFDKYPFDEDGNLPIIPCPYFVGGKGDMWGCLYKKIYTNDPVFGDQIKICNK